MMLCSQARESLKNIPNPSLRPDLTTPYAKPYLWTPVPYARMFFQNSFVDFLTFPLSGLFFVAHIYNYIVYSIYYILYIIYILFSLLFVVFLR